jgi:hypothetical protein
MNDRELGYGGPPETRSASFMQRLWRRWRLEDPRERYLAAATDLADLERRMRALELGRSPPVFVTFNH